MYLKDDGRVYVHAEDEIVITRATNPITGKTLFLVRNQSRFEGFITDNIVIDGVKLVCE